MYQEHFKNNAKIGAPQRNGEDQATHHRNTNRAGEEQIHHPLQILPEPTKTLSRAFMKHK